jgi:creatinine amidohydrolase/Fe(II)-dependent formamide hydrolase-like protein
LAAEFNAGGSVQVLAVTAFPPDTGVGHASRAETSIMMAIAPETVKLDNLPPLGQPLKNVQNAIIDYHTFSGEPTAERTVRADDDPRLSSAEEGHEMIQSTARHLAALVKEAVNNFRRGSE